ncbi:MAG: prolyl oligopeptidase family serine peptidase [Deltaproteobacteria bacterium]
MNPLRNSFFRVTVVVPLLVLTIGTIHSMTQPVAADEPSSKDGPPTRANVESQVSALEVTLHGLRADSEKRTDAALPTRALLSDVEIFVKGAKWAMRYDTDGRSTDAALIQKAVARGVSRARELNLSRCPSWAAKRGRVVRGYASSVDGSVQPYGLVIPKGYNPERPIRLDVVLHGSTRPQGASELKFMERFDDGDTDSRDLVDQPFIELHPLGRVENCYRWAGETDVFEAIEDVCRKYSIDRDRIVLRGMSMGASGTWHLGLKHPDKFVALGPYCGYVDTHRFSETPLDNFVRVGPLPEHQELALHMLDSVDYAANAGVVPAIACMGEKDVFFQAHVIMGEAMQHEGLTMVNLISPGTGHVIDPVTHAEQMRRIGEYAARGINHVPRKLRFVTWTLKYPRCHWLELRGLAEHYRRSEISARLLEGGVVEIDEPRNITRFAVLPEALPDNGAKVRIAGKEFAIEENREEAKPRAAVVFVRRGEGWDLELRADAGALARKRPGLTGPIDDAFTTKFLCVRGTGRPWNAHVQSYADASLRRFAYEWHRYFRGDLPVKDDKDVTDDDVRDCNLILFGDPGSNSWIDRVLPDLPICWTRSELVAAGATYPAVDHVPSFIHPNPLAAKSGTDRYVVLNSGHTFRETELNKLNYLLFPRWGDWAVLKVGDKVPENPSDALDETVLKAGFFDEEWQFGRERR